MGAHLKALRKNEEVKAAYEEYKYFKDELKEIYKLKYYVARPMAYKTDSGNADGQENGSFAMTTWTGFEPTVIPVCDYIIIMLFDKENDEEYFNSYIIPEKELLDLITDPWSIVLKPVLHYILNFPSDEVAKKILEKSVFMGRQKIIKPVDLSKG